MPLCSIVTVQIRDCCTVVGAIKLIRPSEDGPDLFGNSATTTICYRYHLSRQHIFSKVQQARPNYNSTVQAQQVQLSFGPRANDPRANGLTPPPCNN